MKKVDKKGCRKGCIFRDSYILKDRKFGMLEIEMREMKWIFDKSLMKIIYILRSWKLL